ncbi:hypothetical protein SAMD00019534_124010 [Acytostelium subglobosum LB1]|uniref:hypothetical protein n=1 Tax=Acytostelium subglobosum LB1 TaxID=1410327 RepID=UPI000644CE91|nr:hypothetical protein SAMD00019534_124010 [Acytostelium subglobosum LB1]GAM29225.1 hypothetical protein SAMD00019534_124010 [Acytostelium subglobosum LB1]|eukprot:XP_012747799.1 hypothetical protein SAMD00019534_124010 [Acytostelium subglobosum LB1]
MARENGRAQEINLNVVDIGKLAGRVNARYIQTLNENPGMKFDVKDMRYLGSGGPVVKVSMLRTLHGMSILYSNENLWRQFLLQCTEQGCLESVQFLLDNEPVSEHDGLVYDTAIFTAATIGHLDILVRLMNISNITTNINKIISLAGKHGQIHIIDHLKRCLLDDDSWTMAASLEPEVAKLRSAPPPLLSLVLRPMIEMASVLKNGNQHAAEAIFDWYPQAFGKDSPIWGNLTPELCTFIVTRRPNHPRSLNSANLSWLIVAIRDNTLPTDIGYSYLTNCTYSSHITNGFEDNALTTSAGISLPLMLLVAKTTGQELNGVCLVRAITRGCYETMKHLLEAGLQPSQEHTGNALINLVSIGSIESIELLRHHKPLLFQNNPGILEYFIPIWQSNWTILVHLKCCDLTSLNIDPI